MHEDVYIYVYIPQLTYLDYNNSYIDERDFNYKKYIYDFELS